VVAVHAAPSITRVAKMLSDSISTMMGPKIAAALLWRRIPFKVPAKYCRTARPMDPKSAPRAMSRSGLRSRGRIQ